MASPLVQALLGAAASERKQNKVAKASKPSPPATAAILAAGLPSMPVKQERMPTHLQRLKEDMQHTKRRATERWVNGEISSKQHSTIHARADQVMRDPQRFVKPAKGKR